jgi:hypothetical protein
VPLKDGGKAIPFRMDFLLTREDLIRVLCFWQKDWSSLWSVESQPLPELGKLQVDQTIRNMLRYTGWESFVFWSDGLRDEDVKVIWTWAEKTIERVYEG